MPFVRRIFRTKRRHLNASDSRTDGVNCLLSVDGVASSEEYYWHLSTSVIGKFSRPRTCVLCKRLAAPSDVELKKNMIIMKLQGIYTKKSSRVAFVKGKMLIPTIAYYHFNIKNNHLVMFNFIWWHFCWKVELFFLSSAERN